MLIFSMVDFFKAIVLLFVIEGIIYFLFPKHVQGFAVRCLVDAKPANLRLFGLILIGTGIFLTLFFGGKLTQ
ncbi:MAG: DUF2065 domain-containing protein [Alphaproteobacteria bacterium]|nr:DUF2065 domain-containing protein [Alphaproteobacteria bacterium]